jgi:hypothetical protein
MIYSSQAFCSTEVVVVPRASSFSSYSCLWHRPPIGKTHKSSQLYDAVDPTILIQNDADTEKSVEVSAAETSSANEANQQESTHHDDDSSSSSEQRPIFDLVASRAALCLYESEMRRDAKTQGATTQATSMEWINEAASFALQKTIDRVKLKVKKSNACR